MRPAQRVQTFQVLEILFLSSLCLPHLAPMSLIIHPICHQKNLRTFSECQVLSIFQSEPAGPGGAAWDGRGSLQEGPLCCGCFLSFVKDAYPQSVTCCDLCHA